MLYRDVHISDSLTCKSTGKSCFSGFCQHKSPAIADVLAYQNEDVVARIGDDLCCDAEMAQDLFLDVKRFLFMAATQSQSKPLYPTPRIDEGWHTFLLFTKEYAEFCDDFFGNFLHHIPRHLSDPVTRTEDLYPTVDAMHAAFGGVPSDNWHYVAVNA